MSARGVTMVAVDGTDALAYVIIRPNKTGDGVILEAAASGLSKPTAARVLRHIADQWDPPDRAEGSSFANRREEGGTG